MYKRSVVCCLIGMAMRAMPVLCQTVPVRDLSRPVLTSPVSFHDVAQVVSLSDGRVLVHDRGRRQVLLLDTQLRNPIPVLDSLPGRLNSYTNSAARLMSYRADSSLVYTASGGGFVVVSPQGAIVRDIAGIPSAPALGIPTPVGYSPALGIIAILPVNYRSNSAALARAVSQVRPTSGQSTTVDWFDDSAFVVAVDPLTRRSDTVARIHHGRFTVLSVGPGGPTFGSIPALFPFIDQVAVAADGGVALFRARSYRVDWISPQKTISVSRPIPFGWRRLADADKERLLDSVNAVLQARFQQRLDQWIADSIAQGGPPRQASTRGSMIRSRPIPSPPTEVRELPDFMPPVKADALLADADNRVWIRPITDQTLTDGATVYDVVDKGGRPVARVRTPAGILVVGFAPGHVFVIARDAGRVTLMKVALN
jgi:hypothetical protein